MQRATLSDTYKLIWFLWNVTNDFKHVKLAWFFFFLIYIKDSLLLLLFFK